MLQPSRPVSMSHSDRFAALTPALPPLHNHSKTHPTTSYPHIPPPTLLQSCRRVNRECTKLKLPPLSFRFPLLSPDVHTFVKCHAILHSAGCGSPPILCTQAILLPPPTCPLPTTRSVHTFCATFIVSLPPYATHMYLQILRNRFLYSILPVHSPSTSFPHAHPISSLPQQNILTFRLPIIVILSTCKLRSTHSGHPSVEIPNLEFH